MPHINEKANFVAYDGHVESFGSNDAVLANVQPDTSTGLTTAEDILGFMW